MKGIRIRSVSVSDQEAAELATRLRAHGDKHGLAVSKRLETGLLSGVAVVGTTKEEAQAVLIAIDSFVPERLQELRDSLREFVEREAA